MELNKIEEAIEDIRNGKVVIVVDDEDRENEGDFITAARNVTPEIINFMATHGRGLICAPLAEDRCEELGLDLMVSDNTALHETPFTISVDLIGHGCTTGISASDRAKTVQALIDPKTKASDLGRPGHIFPLKARNGGVLRRTGHTEATIDLARLAGFEPAGVLVEIMNEDGTMARLPQLREIAEKFDLKIISIEDLVAYRLENESLIEKKYFVNLPTRYGDFTMVAYEQTTSKDIHLALIKGEWDKDEPIPVRVHSHSLLRDIFGVLTDYSDPDLEQVMELVQNEGKGVIVYMNQKEMGSNVLQQLESYAESKKERPQEDLPFKLKMDSKDYGVGAQILRDLGVGKIKLISNSPKKRTGIIGYGLEIVENISIESPESQPLT